MTKLDGFFGAGLMDEPSPIPSLPLHVDSGTLVASLIWGAIGAGFFIYGKKQRSAPPLFGGIALVAGSYFIGSALWMSVASLGIIAGIYYWSRCN
ncbi:MAG: hypothetical protein ABSH38_02990 [Verrucomicrobiota bacterium]|jgi:hypothetical protein